MLRSFGRKKNGACCLADTSCLQTPVITVGLSGFGDLMQQYYEHLKKHGSGWDQRRSRNICLSGLVIGPICHFWYLYLDKALPGRTLRVVFKKVLADQIIISPLCVASFLFVIAYSEGATKLEMANEFKTKAPALLKAEWLVWPPAQVINFLVLPTRYRVLYDNLISLGFDNYYSYVKYRRDRDASQEHRLKYERSADEESSDNYLIPEAAFASDISLDFPPMGRNICARYYIPDSVASPHKMHIFLLFLPRGAVAGSDFPSSGSVNPQN
ncbi:hypothetical protein LSH36_326g05038 [Paralvinella palmiformis]|uniref:Mpv17-like protein 2 n=1 Tax=Paralvinella palmiformis TaxID=53620 RepID=A0AAD9N2E0_9ANNE|nr:hypothetical protein LSH36_326g05038 [Paralvinella palmiformis]